MDELVGPLFPVWSRLEEELLLRAVQAIFERVRALQIGLFVCFFRPSFSDILPIAKLSLSFFSIFNLLKQSEILESFKSYSGGNQVDGLPPAASFY